MDHGRSLRVATFRISRALRRNGAVEKVRRHTSAAGGLTLIPGRERGVTTNRISRIDASEACLGPNGLRLKFRVNLFGVWMQSQEVAAALPAERGRCWASPDGSDLNIGPP